jgi:protein-S-isoprenylcysteine O-methyltransferase Ste14
MVLTAWAMPHEDPYRITLLAILCVTLVMVGYHRWQASRSSERISHKEEGYVFAVSLRLAALVMLVAAVAHLVNPTCMAWSQLPIPTALRWLGAGAGAIFIGFMYWTLANLGKNLTDTVVTRSAATLVTTGPYRWIRHPFYVNVALVMLCVTLLTASWLIGLSGLLVMVMLIVRTSKEEEQLVEKFGGAYRDYMATTGRFWPKLRFANKPVTPRR